MPYEWDKADYIMMLKAVASGCDTKEDLEERRAIYVSYLTDAVRCGDLIRHEAVYTCTKKALEFISHYNRVGKRIK
jgi:hypothetical protein